MRFHSMGLLLLISVSGLAACGGDSTQYGGESQAGNSGEFGGTGAHGGASPGSGGTTAGSGGTSTAAGSGGTSTAAGGTAGSSGTGAGTGGTGGSEERQPPESPQASKPSGIYGISSAFACVQILNIEEGGLVRYTVTSDGSAPPMPGATSAILTRKANEVCDLNQNATVNFAFIAEDASGNESPIASYSYTFDTTAPVIASASHDVDSVIYPDSSIHFKLKSEPLGTAKVRFGSKDITLVDSGMNGDAVAGDGIYEGSYQVKDGDDLSAATVTAIFADAAGNSAIPFEIANPITIDTLGAKVGGTAITTNQTWKAAGNPYIIDADTVTLRDAKLTIEPGVVFVFRNDAELQIRGEVQVVGSVDAPIIAQGKGQLYIIPNKEAVTYGSCYQAPKTA